MINFSNIVGTLMQSGLSGSTTDRLQNALSAGGETTGGVLSGLTDALSGLMDGSKGGGGIGGMLESVLGDAGRVLGENKNLALGGLGALAGSLLGGGGKSLKGAIGGGAMAMLGAMAFKALKGAGETEPEVPLGLREAEGAEQEAELERGAELVLKAMINAAKADGRIDQEEVQRIVGKLDEAGESKETRDYLLTELSKPLDMEGFIAEVRNQPQLAPQIYAASLLAIEVDTPAEKEYMQQLARNLNLDRGVAADLEKTLGIS
ncbi:MAG: tellurite resistance TerB family protein [Thermodesulfobacteriota bacterium]|nr:tellurite resistance TerB family protein [Thermodesulfobacteriota bacterium]